jgi:hypothetical protein
VMVLFTKENFPTSVLDIPKFLLAISSILLELGHDHFFPNSFPLISHRTIWPHIVMITKGF